jgi:hypothetical protein
MTVDSDRQVIAVSMRDEDIPDVVTPAYQTCMLVSSIVAWQLGMMFDSGDCRGLYFI